MDNLEDGVKKLKISFMGGKQAGCIGLLSLYTVKCEALGVVSYNELVTRLAKKLNLPIFSSIKDNEFIDLISKSDLLLNVHGREIVPLEILKMPFLVCINVHPCLHKYKGTSPIERLLKDNITKARVGVYYMAEEVYAGEVIVEKFVNVSGKKNCGRSV